MNTNTNSIERDDSRRETVRVLMMAYRGMLDGFEKSIAADLKRLCRMARSLEHWATVGGSMPALAARYSFALQAIDHPCTCGRTDACETCRAATELRDFWAPFDLDAPLLTALDLMSGRRREARLWAALNSIEEAIASGTNNSHITRAMMDAGLAAAGLDPRVLDGEADDVDSDATSDNEECEFAVHGSRPQLRLLRGELSDAVDP